ncbi:hypothetical protein DFA_04079 [Cavenderia fasciculata]|uniref:Ankyrin repeat-containing protein n=1 Tax=Cavenderia fasciculata TaxID=261658 RepID=F4Q184_CACFS|nr:uncharacterized protein DFA_04079 [Cavenderia fasciculata]EGG18585.1 hypothetical protein DFA_04079 [Cavenderia fasciculata]|eukprot:XP_004366489.1 hypothetical protein DFA_04079 [Cavenderia fasciculata]
MTCTFINLIRVPYIRQVIFNSFTVLYSKSSDDDDEFGLDKAAKKGRDIINSPRLAMISKYAMPWDFIKHYLPSEKEKVVLGRRMQVIKEYCAHPNATYDTLLKLLEWSPEFEYRSDLAFGVVKRGHIKILEYWINKFPQIKLQDDLLVVAAVNGHLPIVQLLNTFPSMQDKDYSEELMMDKVAKNGHLSVVKWLHINRSDVGCTQDAIDGAASNGHLDVIKFLHENRIEGASEFALNQSPNLEIAQFLHYNRSEGCTTLAMDNAVINESMDVLEFLHTHRTEGCSMRAYHYAAMHGRLDVLKFLHLNRTEGSSSRAMDLAIQNDQSLEVISFIESAFKKGCTHASVTNAINNNRLDILEFLHQHFPSPNIWVDGINNAFFGHVDLNVLKFLVNNRTERIPGGRAIDYAAKAGDLESVKFFIANGMTPNVGYSNDSTMDFAASHGHLELVKFLHENRSEGCTSHAMTLAARNGHTEVVEYLYKNRTEGCTSSVFFIGVDAKDDQHYQAVKFILDNHILPKGDIDDSLACRLAENHQYEIVDLVNQYIQKLNLN